MLLRAGFPRHFVLFQEIMNLLHTELNGIFVSEKVKVLWKGFSSLSNFNLEILIKQADQSQGYLDNVSCFRGSLEA